MTRNNVHAGFSPHTTHGRFIGRLLNAIYTITLALTLAACASAVTGPNILLITSEDNGPDLGCYGDPFVRTPNLDRLAAEGVRFERAFVATASCSESRAALLTGLYPHQNGQIGLATHHYRMYGDLPNLVSHLRAEGYRTGLIGKLHVNPESAFPFDYRPDVDDCNGYSRRDVHRVAQLAEEFMRKSNGPCFLMVNYADAHLPFLKQQYRSPGVPLTGDDVRLLPWIGLDAPRLRDSQADYYNCLMRLDDGIGQLMEVLNRNELVEDTLVAYLSDHGAQFPRGKLCSYESSLRVPLVLRWPSHIAPGQVQSRLVSTIDILPTLLEAAGVKIPSGLPGRSLLPLARGQADSWREYLCTEYHSHYPPLYFPQRTVRDDRFKLIVNLRQDSSNPIAASYCQDEKPPFPSYATPSDVATAREEVRRAYATWRDAPSVELYDLETDPYEWRNRADDPKLSAVMSRLLAALGAWRVQTADPLLDEEKLALLTAEHDAVAHQYVRPKEFHWQYAKYLAPENAQATR